MNIESKIGQSNYDICLSGYGNLDDFIKMLNDNKIRLSSSTATEYSIDSNSNNINTNFIGYAYNTKANIDGRIYGDEYGDEYL